jgi:hypothetical protein
MNKLRRNSAELAVLLVGAALTLATVPARADVAQNAQSAQATGHQGDSWASIAKLPDWRGIWELDWQHSPALMRPAPPKLLPDAQAKLDAYRKAQGSGENLQPQQANCLPPGMPGIMTQPYPIEFAYMPGKVVILVEAYMQFRHIYTDGRTHPADPDPTFQGHSIGHWEGDTLVVDTVGFVPFSQIAPGVGHSDQMRIVERIHRVGPESIQIQQTIIDPKVLAEPWTTVHPYSLVKDDLREYICEQNNHDSADDAGRPGIKVN